MATAAGCTSSGSRRSAARRLCDVAYECMWLGIEQVRPGATLGDIGQAIQRHAEAAASRSCASSAATASAGGSTRSRRSCTTAAPGTGERLVQGMTFTVEPMINAGRREIRELADGWTIVTKDHSAVGAVGAHGAGHRRRLRGSDRVGRHAGTAGDQRGGCLNGDPVAVRLAERLRRPAARRRCCPLAGPGAVPATLAALR